MAARESQVWITLADGVRLAASIHLPRGDGPWPVLLEALPYRKDDLTASYRHEYRRLCDEGHFAVARVDLRGTGSSEGIAVDEYPPQEQSDLAEVIAWLAARPWSTGAVGLFGTSYSGFNALQTAVEGPPALRAVCAVYASDDRYTDDVHFRGGALRGLDLVDYVLYMVAMNALPPVPAVYGEGWRDEWRRRVEGTEPWLLRWLDEQHDGPYWRRGSLRLGPRNGERDPGYERIRCPTMLVSGWADGYRNASLRAFAALRCRKRLLLGPWSHMAPGTSVPGPRIDLVPELVRWFDRHLRDAPDPPDDEPPIALYVRHPVAPAPDLEEQPGEWRYETDWPAERLRTIVLRVGGEGSDVVDARGDVGSTAWISCAGRLPWGLPLDQRPDEVYSLTYTWAPEADPVEVLGYPRVSLRVAASAPVAFLSAKLCDVFPDGTSALVSRGFLNLALRDFAEAPRPLVPGEPCDVVVELDATSWVVETGHRVRLTLAGTDWPDVWPPPQPVTLAVERASIEVELPVLIGPAPLTPCPAFERPPVSESRGADEGLAQPPVVWRLEHDVLGRRTRAVVAHGAGYDVAPGAPPAHVVERYDGTVAVSTVDPGDAGAEASARFEITWDGAAVASEARLRLRSDADAYHVEVDLDVSDGSSPFASRRWQRTVPRRLQ